MYSLCGSIKSLKIQTDNLISANNKNGSHRVNMCGIRHKMILMTTFYFRGCNLMLFWAFGCDLGPREKDLFYPQVEPQPVTDRLSKLNHWSCQRVFISSFTVFGGLFLCWIIHSSATLGKRKEKHEPWCPTVSTMRASLLSHALELNTVGSLRTVKVSLANESRSKDPESKPHVWSPERFFSVLPPSFTSQYTTVRLNKD